MSWWESYPAVGAAPAAPAEAEKQGWWSSFPRVDASEPANVRQDTGKAAGVGTAAITSLADDPQAQIRYFARQRGIPEERYAIVDGQIAFKDDDRKWYAEVPKGWSPGAVARRAAQGVGPSLPIVSGTVGGILSSPLLLAGPAGMAGSMAITGASAAGGQAAREALANQLMNQDISPWRIAGHGATAAVGQGIGAGLTSWATRAAAEDIKQLDRAASQALRDKAGKFGISLTPAEETGLASLRAQQKYLGNAPLSQNTIQDFYQMRGGQGSDAVEAMLRRISPVDSAEEAGRIARKASDAAIRKARDYAEQRAAPWYEQAFEENDSMASPVLDKILETPAGKTALARARVKMQNDMEKMGVTDNALTEQAKDAGMDVGPVASGLKLRVFDYVKRSMDDMIKEAERNASFDDVRILTGLRSKLVGELDSLDKTGKLGDAPMPGGGTYALARRTYAGEIPEIRSLEDGLVGIVRDKPDSQLGNVARTIFGDSSGPLAVKKAREAISSQNPEAWQAIKRAWLQDIFAKSSQEFASAYGATNNTAGKFAAAVRGDMRTVAKLKAALTDSEFQTLNELTDVLKAAGSVKPIGSDTEWNRLLVEAERAKARPLVAKLAANVNPAQALRNFDEWLTNRAMGHNAEAMAQIVTQPGAADNLKALRAVGPRSVQFRVILGHLLGQGGAGAVDGAYAAAIGTQ